MKSLLPLLLLLFSLNTFGQTKSGEIIVTGKITGDLKGHTKIYTYGDVAPRDSAQIQDGKFKFVFPFQQPAAQSFLAEYELKSGRWNFQPFEILIDQPGEVHFDVGDITAGFSKTKLSGMESAVSYQAFTEEQRNITTKISQIVEKQYGKSRVSQNDPLYGSINKAQDSLQQVYLYPFITIFIKAHSDKYVGIFVLHQFRKTLNLTLVEQHYQMLTPKIKNTDLGKKMAAYIEGTKNSKIGELAYNFTLPDTLDKPFELGQLKGKYVVLDFWASWCGPCLVMFPRMRELYSKYRGKNIEFVNISTDKDRDAWRRAIAKENNPWPQLRDTKDISVKMFAANSLPTTYLIDPDGKIIAKDFGDVEFKLMQLLGK